MFCVKLWFALACCMALIILIVGPLMYIFSRMNAPSGDVFAGKNQ